MSVRWSAVLLFAASFAGAAEIKGKITTVVGGENLGRVQVSAIGDKAFDLHHAAMAPSKSSMFLPGITRSDSAQWGTG